MNYCLSLDPVHIDHCLSLDSVHREYCLDLDKLKSIGAGRFRILGGPRFRILGGGGGAKGGPNSQQALDVITKLMRRNDVASTSFRCHVPTRYLINQCQIITFLILGGDNH